MPYNSAAESFHTKKLCSRLSSKEIDYVQFMLIGKHVVDFLLVIIELFFARCYGGGATSEYRLQVVVFEGGGSRRSKISDTRGHHPPTICARIDRPVNALQLCC